MVPQPTVDNSAAVIIHRLIRSSEEERWVDEFDDLVKQVCMAHRHRYFRNEHAL